MLPSKRKADEAAAKTGTANGDLNLDPDTLAEVGQITAFLLLDFEDVWFGMILVKDEWH